jgi:hypothetical protein
MKWLAEMFGKYFLIPLLQIFMVKVISFFFPNYKPKEKDGKSTTNN